jgi:U4/U6 small nuclear ribonucleoprotein PRP3
MELSRKELLEIRPDLEKVCVRVMGLVDEKVMSVFERGLSTGYDKEKFIKKFSSFMEEKKAIKLANKLETVVDYDPLTKPAKKRMFDDGDFRDSKRLKVRHDDEGSNGAEAPSGPLTSSQIQQMMADAQRQIEERKKKLEAMQSAQGAPNVLNMTVDDRQKRIAELQRQIQAKLSGIAQPAIAVKATDKPRPLILDQEGRTIDPSGREINIQTVTPTLKANIRAKKKETIKHQQAEKVSEEAKTIETVFYDERIVAKPAVRGKRALRFHEPGKFEQMGEQLRMKAQMEKLQNEISQIARKTGISSATKLALMAPKTDIHSEEIPALEWWDSCIIDDYCKEVNGKIFIREEITNLIEHPVQVRPPIEPMRGAYLPVFLTKKEQKKLRRQNRREAWKEEQEKIRLGLIDPPEPKLKISNLMRVLGTEAVQDPTKIEAHVREQMQKRQKAHEDENQTRKLTDEQRREKKIRKLKEDTTTGVNVSVYRIKDLSNQSKRFKVETNAKQLFMTGIVILFRDCNVVVVEGGPKQQKKYRRLMMHRIKWEEDFVKVTEEGADKEQPNSAKLVWEGKMPKRSFGEMKIRPFPMEKPIRELFQKHHCEHFWDLAYSGAILETAVDDD